MIKQKGFQDYLNDDPSLREKITYEEFMDKKAAPKDNEEISIEEAYDYYRRVLETDNKINTIFCSKENISNENGNNTTFKRFSD